MTTEKSNQKTNSDDFRKLLEKSDFIMPRVGEYVKGAVISASKSEVRIDIGGILTGVVRGPELYEEDEEYANLKPGDEVEATVIEGENENNELELSFRYAGQEKAWSGLRSAYEKKKAIKVKVIDANKGGLLVKYRQISGFLPVSQLAPENYPRVNGGDKGKILEKLKSFAGKEFEVAVMAIEEKEDKIIFSEKEAWNEKQRDVISKYKVGTVVEGAITAITDFGVFLSFGENLEGLIHISELAWQRIDDPSDLFKVGDKIKAEVISLENAKIFLSAKKLIKDPWQEVGKKYKLGQIAESTVLKVNPFGLFVKLDKDIHGLAHISQLGLAPKQRINDKFKVGQKYQFEIVSMEPKEHRLGLVFAEKRVGKASQGEGDSRKTTEKEASKKKVESDKKLGKESKESKENKEDKKDKKEKKKKEEKENADKIEKSKKIKSKKKK
jgi:small subunit ribosomal protein S1